MLKLKYINGASAESTLVQNDEYLVIGFYGSAGQAVLWDHNNNCLYLTGNHVTHPSVFQLALLTVPGASIPVDFPGSDVQLFP